MRAAISKKLYAVMIAFITLFVVSMSGCDSPQGDTAAVKKKQDNVPFRIAVVTWVGHGPFYLAKEKGFYKKYDLNIDIQKIEDIGARRSALLAGQLEGIITSVDAFANGAANGLKAKTIMKLGEGDGADGIVAKQGINSVSDLKGHTIAFEKGTPSHFFLLLALEENGLTSKDIIPRYMTAGDAGAAFVGGSVDACVTWEPWVSTAKEKSKGNILVTSSDRPGILVDTFAVRNDVIKDRPDDVTKFIKAWFDAIEYWKKNPEESNKIMAKSLGVPYEDFVAMMAGDKFSDYQDNLKYFGTSEAPGQFWEVFARANKAWKSEGLINVPVSPANYTDTSFIHNLYN
jgi:NitT/TauT family transport system substrate-binding protein